MKTYPLFKVHVGDVDRVISSISEVMKSGFLNEGVQVTQLRDALSEKFQTENLVLTNSCTSALTVALKLAGVEHGDKVISTAMTCLATNCPIVNLGADIVWADIDPMTGCLDVNDVRRELTKNTGVKAVMVVAWAGIPPMLKDLRDVCHEHGAKLILDAAHAMGATFLSHPIHAWADYTCYSLQAIKHVTSGDGGVLICRDQLERARRLKWFGIDRDAAKDEKGDWRGQHWDFDVAEAGFKFNMNNLAAAVGLAQVDHIDSVVKAHRNNARTYTDIFEVSRYVKPLRASFGASHWVYTLRVKGAINRDAVLQSLNEAGVMAGVVHVPNHRYTCFKKYTKDLPNVQSFAASQISLPVGWWLSTADVKHIAREVEETCKKMTT